MWRRRSRSGRSGRWSGSRYSFGTVVLLVAGAIVQYETELGFYIFILRAGRTTHSSAGAPGSNRTLARSG